MGLSAVVFFVKLNRDLIRGLRPQLNAPISLQSSPGESNLPKLRVAVITVTRNAERHIRFNIESVASQNYQLDHYIYDGGSTDDTLAIASSLTSTVERLFIREINDNGIYNAINIAVAELRSDYDVIALLHADDYYITESSISKAIARFTDDNIDAVCANVGYVKSPETPLLRLTRYQSCDHVDTGFFKTGGQFAHPGIFVRSRVYDDLSYDECLDISADYEFQLSLVSGGGRIVVVSDHLVNQRTGGYSQAGLWSFIRGKMQIFAAARRRIGLWACVVVPLNIYHKLKAKI